jgi:ankyrin repeat protein
MSSLKSFNGKKLKALIIVLFIMIPMSCYSAKSDDDAFLKAAKAGKQSEVKDHLRMLASYSLKEKLNCTDKHGRTALMLAAEKGHVEVVELLVDKGADLMVEDEKGETALDKAKKAKKGEVVEFLDFARAREINTLMGFDEFIRMHPESEYVEDAKRFGESRSFEYAKEKNTVAAYESFLKSYPDGTFADSARILIETREWEHCNKNSESELSAFLRKYPNSRIVKTTSLVEAVEADRRPLVEFLLSMGADANNEGGIRIPLGVAALKGNLPMAELLISAGARVNGQTPDGWTPLCIAAGADKHEMMKLLLARGADVHITNNDGLSPLHVAAGKETVGSGSMDGSVDAMTGDYLDGVAMLVDAGAGVNLKDTHGLTPLHYAALYGNLEIVDYLVSKGADVNGRTNDGWTPLCIAASVNSPELTGFLIEKKADVNLSTLRGSSPIIFAARNGNMKIIGQLLAAGANVEYDGPDALIEAKKNGFIDVAETIAGCGITDNPGYVYSPNPKIKFVQDALAVTGYDIKRKDGLMDDETRRVIGKFESDIGRTPECELTRNLAKSLLWEFGECRTGTRPGTGGTLRISSSSQIKCKPGCAASMMGTSQGMQGYIINCGGMELVVPMEVYDWLME